MDRKITEALSNPDAPQVWKGVRREGPSLRERLMRGVEIDNDSGCWNSTVSPSQKYPMISIANRSINRHRCMFYIHNGYFPQVVMHSCDNTLCINPDHLIGGSYKDNTADMLSKGRGVFPDKSSHCKRGHLLTSSNLYYKKNGDRQCKQCTLDRG